MPLTPLDIHNKEFTRGFRGYDEDEVNEFLDQVIKDYEIVIRQKKELEREVSQLNERLGHFNDIETTLNKSILVAQETAEDVKNSANKESKLIIKEAEKNADRIINEALEKSRRINIEVEDMKKQAKVFKTRLRMLVEAQIDMIDNDDWDHLFDTELDDEKEVERKMEEEYSSQT
ncbi:cell division initiation protein [Halobacillus karajensis]|uniref:Minicell-associated protein DivIVA n=2 Tax=Halobacillus TaxID=45667 RepID=A0A024P1W6_9BACI|nr:DivIVA domain-containing protein [Halobacillus karajensis]CDQ19824.1 Minicell-associated protein DivIVA [Halobacillus karajensis]CDQ22284.1 Minicell-associated protein DivIVA [Halobacillus karajensis]CDQ28125.1 Minicell-associated protein DivIVA [Halobacillus karajensis]SEH71551.1 cell division initiation protein [Halobacillus karajensis]